MYIYLHIYIRMGVSKFSSYHKAMVLTMWWTNKVTLASTFLTNPILTFIIDRSHMQIV